MDREKFIDDLTRTLSKHGFNRDQISDVILWCLTLDKLEHMQKEITDLYDPTPVDADQK